MPRRDIIGLIVAVLGTEAIVGLLLPYLGWVSFAAYLNAGIWRLN